MAKITYENKVALNVNSDIADINKVTASDLNEIKNVVNTNDDNTTNNSNAIGTLSNLNTTEKSNLVGAINEVKQNIMSLSMAANQSVNVTSETVINFSKSTSAGNKLTFNSSNHSIEIGKNVSKIKVNFNAFAKNGTTDWVWFKINKNGTFTNLGSMVGKIGAWSSASLSPAILDVSENDYIQMTVTYGTANSENYVRYDGTNMTVEVVE